MRISRFILTALAGISVNAAVYAAEADIYLGHNRAAAPNVFTDGLKAFAAVNEAAKTSKSVTLYVEPGVWWLDDPDVPGLRTNPRGNGEVPYAVEVACDSLTIIGLGGNPEDIVFAVNRGQTQGALGNYTLMHFTGRAMRVENLTFGNYCNVDLVYPADTTKNRPKRREAIVQAQIGWLDGTDKLFARNCHFLSRLNLCPLMGANRSLYKDCYFECTDDALTGSAVYLDCSFTFYSGKPLYSAPDTGAVFLNCDIHSLTKGHQYFTKAPGAVTAVDVRFTHPEGEGYGTDWLQWTRDESPVRCYQSNVTVNGKPYNVDSNRPGLWVNLDGTGLLSAYKVTMPDGRIIYNTPNLLGGNDGWDPLGMLPEIYNAEMETGRELRGLPVALKLNAAKCNLQPQQDVAKLEPVELKWGGYPAVVAQTSAYTWSGGDAIKIRRDDFSVFAESCNVRELPSRETLECRSEYGLCGACEFNVAPYLTEPPQFAKSPALKEREGIVRLDYSLEGEGEDDSRIVWYRCSPDGSDMTAVRHGHGAEGREYPLAPGDKGHSLAAVVFPKFRTSFSGDSIITKPMAVKGKTAKRAGEEETRLATSFKEIPIVATQPGKRGYWHFDSYKPSDTSLHKWNVDGRPGWYYGRGVDAVTGEGIIQSVRGARMSYTPVRETTEAMALRLVAEPAKGPGQGFGSATGQYMDICLGFDPVSLSGYALRIERTPEYDKAVTFTLVEYSNGETKAISDSVPTSCFRNPCNISLLYNKGRIIAEAFTEALAVETKDSRIRENVKLECCCGPLPGSSFAVQHTGTTGPGATLLRNLEIIWK